MIASTLISHHTDTDVMDIDMEPLEMLPGQIYDCIYRQWSHFHTSRHEKTFLGDSNI